MAKIEIVTLSDSLDERIQANVETVTFFDPMIGEKLEIELGEANRKHFQNHLDKLAKYIAASRKVEVPVVTKPAVKADGRNAKIREWAQAEGYQIGDRGRIKAEIVEAYDKAHPVNETGAPVVEEIAVTVVETPEIVAEDNMVEVEPLTDDEEPTVEQLEAERVELTDKHILDMMLELENEGNGPVEFDDLLDKAAEVK